MAVELLAGEKEWTLKLGGRVDIFEAVELHAAARDAAERGRGGVVLNVHEVTALDTACTQVLVALRRALAVDGRTLRIEGLTAPVEAAWQRLGVELPRG